MFRISFTLILVSIVLFLSRLAADLSGNLITKEQAAISAILWLLFWSALKD
jgi:hypothetical protein